MEQQPKTRKFALQYGLFLGLASIAFNFLLYTQELHYEQDPISQIVGFVLMAVFIILGILAFKKANGGLISLGQALKTGVGVAVFASLLGAIYGFIFMNVIEPDFADKMAEIAKQQMLEQQPDMTDEQIEFGLDIQKKIINFIPLIGIVMSAIIGLIISLITGLIVKKANE